MASDSVLRSSLGVRRLSSDSAATSHRNISPVMSATVDSINSFLVGFARVRGFRKDFSDGRTNRHNYG